jgi:hypothetical protein
VSDELVNGMGASKTDVTLMPSFYFDLVIGKECREQGGMILETPAAEKADSLAGELAIVSPEIPGG